MDYLTLRAVHHACVALSATGFVLRGIWMLQGTLATRGRWVRILPHGVDTLLLASGVSLAWLSGQYPLAEDWLTAKLAGLVLYVLCGAMALRRGRTLRQRAAWFAAALLVLAYIVGAALRRSPWSWLG